MRGLPEDKVVILLLVMISISILLTNVDLSNLSITFWSVFGGGPSINVSITEALESEILLVYEPYLKLGGRQDIFTEFKNIGSVTFDSTIEETVYYLNGSRIEDLVTYYDTEVTLLPGERRPFNAVFVPTLPGVYYIRVRVPYGTRVKQAWGSFLVYTDPTTTTTTTSPPAPAPTTPRPEGMPNQTLEYPERVSVVQGESRSFDITVTNTGERDLRDVTFYISLSNVLDVDINPKILSVLSQDRSQTFVITIEAPNGTTPGEYTLEFDFVTQVTKKDGRIFVDVLESNVSVIDYLSDVLLNYRFLLDKLESEIYIAYLDGQDMDSANQSLSLAKESLDLAEGLYESGDWEACGDELKKTQTYIEEAVFKMASSTIYVYEPAAYMPFALVLVWIGVAIALFVILYLWRRRERRPKSLKENPEVEMELGV